MSAAANTWSVDLIDRVESSPRSSPAAAITFGRGRIGPEDGNGDAFQRRRRWRAFQAQCRDVSSRAIYESWLSRDQLQAAMRDCLKFSQLVGLQVDPPSLTVAEDGEVVLTWRGGEKRAIASLAGDGTIGYTMLHGDAYVPGDDLALANGATAPTQLIEYLSE